MNVSEYSIGTVSVAAGATVVNAASGGPLWLSEATMRDELVIEGFGPVRIRSVNTDGQLAIDKWPYSSVVGANYHITRDSVLRFNGANTSQALNDLVNELTTDGFYIFVPSTMSAPDPKKGIEGQFARQPSTKKEWQRLSGVWTFIGNYSTSAFADVAPIAANQAILDGDQGKLFAYDSPTALAVSLPQAGAAGQFIKGWLLFVKNINAGDVTFTPTTSTIEGAATFVLKNRQAAIIYSTGTSFRILMFRNDLGTMATQNLADVISFSNATEATGAGTTYAARFAGGVEIAKKLFVAGAVSLSSTLAYGGVTLANTVTGTGSLVASISPALTGAPTVPTAAPGTNTMQISSTAFVQAAITALIGGAPGALDTLKELADAINDDASYATTLTTALATKAPLASPSFSGTAAFVNATLSGTLAAAGDFAINTNKFTVAASSGNAAVAGTLGVTGNLAINTNKFTVAAASGNTVIAGTLGLAGDLAINTNKFTVTASSGNTAIAGTVAIAATTASTAAGNGALTIAGGLGVGGDINWTGVVPQAYAPATPTASAGTFATVSVINMKYKQFGKFVLVRGTLSIAGIGSAAGRALIGLPVASTTGEYYPLTALRESGFTQSVAAVNWDATSVLSISLSGLASGDFIHFGGIYAAA